MRHVTCVICGRVFEAHHSGAILCSDKCRKIREKQQERQRDMKMLAAVRNPATLRTCAVCGKPFAALPAQTVCGYQCKRALSMRRAKEARNRPLCAEAEALLAYVRKHY